MRIAHSTTTTTKNTFEDLHFVFARTDTTLLSPAAERALADSLWLGRRRLLLALLQHEHPELRLDAARLEEPHRRPLPSGLRKRLLAAEKRARTCDDPAIVEELAVIDAARDQLFQHNVRLVAWVAKGFRGKGLELADLFQEGTIALIWSIDRFGPAREVRLSTFASQAIKLGIVRALSDKGRAIRIPNYRSQEAVQAGAARAKLLYETGQEPSSRALERATGIPAEQVEELMASLRPAASIDAPIGGSNLVLGDVLTDEARLSPFEAVVRTESSEIAGKALARLPERERRIVTMRYGLVDAEERSYEDIGRHLGLSRERTRQLELAARAKMRNVIESGRL